MRFLTSLAVWRGYPVAVLHAAVTVRGQVLDPKGAPLPDVAVLAESDALDMRCEASSATSDAQGRFVLEHVPLGDVVLRAHRRGYLLNQKKISLREAADVSLTLTPGDGATVRLRVRGLPQEPSREYLTLRFISMGDGGGTRLPGTVGVPELDEHGECAITGLPPGRYQVSALARGFGITPYPPKVLELAASQRAELELTAQMAEPLVLCGTLVDGKDAPLARKTLGLRELIMDTHVTGTTHDDGTFELRLTAPKNVPLDIKLIDDGLALFDEERRFPFIRMATAPSSPMRLVAEPCARVSGRVLDTEGNPVMAATVSATRETDRGGGPVRDLVCSTTTSRDGSYELRGLNPGDDRVRLEVADPRGVGTLEEVALSPGHSTRAPDVRLAPAAEVYGVVRDAVGRPLPGANVRLCGPQARGLGQGTFTDLEGRYRFAGVRPGRYVATVVRHLRTDGGGVPQVLAEAAASVLGEREKRCIELGLKR